jgi:hypothetical protein
MPELWHGGVFLTKNEHIVSLKQNTSFVLPFTVIILVPACITGSISDKSIPGFVTGVILVASG